MAETIEKELEEAKAKWQQIQQELDKTKSELHDVREELERSQSQLDEVLGELEQTHFELHQLKEKGEQQQSESDGEVKQELAETKSKLQETEQLLEQSQSQLGETMGVLEEYQSQMEKTMGTLEESQGKLQQKQEELEQVKAELAQKQSGSDAAELQKELEKTKSQLRESEELLDKYQSQLEETMGVLEGSQSQLSQLTEKQEQQQSGLESELQKELEETKAKLRDTEELLEQSHSQLQETMEVLEESYSQLQKKQKELIQLKSQGENTKAQLPEAQQQKQSESKLEVERTGQTKLHLEQTEKSYEQKRLFKIHNAIVKPIQIQEKHNKWFGGVVFPDDMPGIFRHRRSGGNLDQEKIFHHQRGGNLDQEIVYLDQLIEVNEQNNLGNDNSDTHQINSSKSYCGTYIYGGPFHPHFGHGLTESIHRLWAFDNNIHDGIVFAFDTSLPANTEYNFPVWFTQILELIDIPLAKCILVTDSCIFENLIVPEPGSELTLGPKKWYRSYLKKLQQRILELTHHLRRDKPEKLFLGRNHIRFSGNIAGEKYLETLLVDEGYTSLEPENCDVIEQLAYIISAKKIIFSEGSAIYLLELIDYLEAEIACFPRRVSHQCIYRHIYSKCANYIIAGNLQDIVALSNWRKYGIKRPIRINKHPDQIIELLRKHNFALLKNWDENKFFAEEKHYIMTYINRAYNFLQSRDPAHRVGVMQKYLQVRGTPQDKLTSQVSNDMPTKSRSDRLNKLASINKSSRYLEIGVSQGTTFNAIEIENKVAVDPKFAFNKDQYANEKAVFLEVSSDEFFKSYAKKFELFDLIYLDGLHTFEQTFRDFCASLACGHSKTIWLIDDTCPGSYAQAQSSLQRCRLLKKFAPEKDRSWMGDVFKVVAAIHDFFPQYSFATFPDHGQTVVWNQWRTDFNPKWNSLEMISRLQYSDFLELQATLFKREPYENIFETIGRSFGQS